jgi:hypothetical protein
MSSGARLRGNVLVSPHPSVARSSGARSGARGTGSLNTAAPDSSPPRARAPFIAATPHPSLSTNSYVSASYFYSAR